MGAIIRLDARHARAYVAEPDGGVDGRVLVVHDAYGLLPHVRSLCDDLAAHGFVAVAPDLFGGATARCDTEATRLLEALTTRRAEEVLDAALQAFDTLGHPGDGAALVGFSIGAEFAAPLVGRGLMRTAVAYDGLPSQAPRGAALLIHLSADGRWDDDEDPAHIAADLRARGVVVVVHHYAGARHGFANADIGAFDVDAATLAWERSVGFLTGRAA